MFLKDQILLVVQQVFAIDHQEKLKILLTYEPLNHQADHHHLLLEHLEVVRHVLVRHHARGARNDALEVVGADLDAGGAVDRLVVQVVRLDADLTQRLRREELAHARDHRPREAAHDDAVAALEGPVGEDDLCACIGVGICIYMCVYVYVCAYVNVYV